MDGENRRRIYRLAYHLLGSARMAERLTQEVFSQALENRFPEIRLDAGAIEQSDAMMWLYRAAVRSFLAAGTGSDTVGDEGTVLCIGTGSDQDGGTGVEPGVGAGCHPGEVEEAGRLAVEGRFRQCVHRNLQSRCWPLDRVLLVMSDIEGLSYPEIACILGVPVDCAESMVSSARARFQQSMAEKRCALVVDSGPCCVCEGARELESEEALRLARAPSMGEHDLCIASRILRTLSVMDI